MLVGVTFLVGWLMGLEPTTTRITISIYNAAYMRLPADSVGIFATFGPSFYAVLLGFVPIKPQASIGLFPGGVGHLVDPMHQIAVPAGTNPLGKGPLLQNLTPVGQRHIGLWIWRAQVALNQQVCWRRVRPDLHEGSD